MNSEMCRSNVSVLEVRIAAKGVHVRSNVAIFGVQHRFRHSVEGVGKVHLASGATNLSDHLGFIWTRSSEGGT